MNLQFWRIEDEHYACYDIYRNGRYITTYECDMYMNVDRPWVLHVGEKSWAHEAILIELGRIERAFAPYNYQNPITAGVLT